MRYGLLCLVAGFGPAADAVLALRVGRRVGRATGGGRTTTPDWTMLEGCECFLLATDGVPPLALGALVAARAAVLWHRFAGQSVDAGVDPEAEGLGDGEAQVGVLRR
mmetsp:Transcript_11855/g.24684  ORF Transcript_11855/g.24684 Transcript_11855/m.24684 type:complete len:107 (-) Transcript_11855:82-402(-)